MLNRLFAPREQPAQRELTAFSSSVDLASPSMSSGQVSFPDIREDATTEHTNSFPKPTPCIDIDAVSEDIADMSLSSMRSVEACTKKSTRTLTTYEKGADKGNKVSNSPSVRFTSSSAIQLPQFDEQYQNMAADSPAMIRMQRELTKSNSEIHRANNLIQGLVSELRGQQSELQILADRIQSKQMMMLDVLDDIATIAETNPENLQVELQRWRTVITEWDWVTCLNDRSHEVGSLIDMANARNGR